MTLRFHPDPGTVVICDFDGLKQPEMTKRRPVVVISPRFRNRDDLCAVVPLSTTDPRKVCPYHHQLSFDPPLPAPYDKAMMWVKADMIYTVGFHRLFLPFMGKDQNGDRVYDVRHVTEADLQSIRQCVLHGLGLSTLTAHL